MIDRTVMLVAILAGLVLGAVGSMAVVDRAKAPGSQADANLDFVPSSQCTERPLGDGRIRYTCHRDVPAGHVLPEYCDETPLGDGRAEVRCYFRGQVSGR